MKDIDTIARDLAKKMRGLNDHEDNDFNIIKSALAAYGDECSRKWFREGQISMRKDARSVCFRPVMLPLMPKMDKPLSRSIEIESVYAFCAEQPPSVAHAHAIDRLDIRALPLPSEVTK